MKKSIRDFFREILEPLFQAAALVIDTSGTFFLVVLAILKFLDSLRPVGMGRFPKHAHAVDMPLYTGLSVATGIRDVPSTIRRIF